MSSTTELRTSPPACATSPAANWWITSVSYTHLASWRDKVAAQKWRQAGSEATRHRLVRVIRDYGMFDRREAPQFYPDAARK